MTGAAPILITGVGKRAGLHLAQTFLGRGQPVIGTFRSDRPALASLREAGATLLRCDFSNDQELQELPALIGAETSRLRAIIHNASDWVAEGGEVAPATVFQRMMRVHAEAPYLLNLALTPLLEAQAPAAADIIHLGDYVSSRGSRKHIAYAASKAAQDNLTLSFAARLAPAIKVNSIAPALIAFNEHDDSAYRAKALTKSLLQREGGWDELQHQVDYLLDSRYVTGRIIAMDGGRHLV